MPHKCTGCGRQFADGSKEMLSGCPDCGGNKFQFEPSGGSSGTTGGAADPDASTAASDAADSSASASEDTSASGVGGTVSQAKQTVSDWVGRGGQSDADDAAAASSKADESMPAADASGNQDAAARADEDADAAASQNADATASQNADATASQNADASHSTSDLGSTRDWPDVGSRDPKGDPTRSNDQTGPLGDMSGSSDGTNSSPSAGDGVPSQPPSSEDGVPAEPPSSEDAAQASARSDVIDPNDLPNDAASDGAEASGHPLDDDRSDTPPDADDGNVVGTPDDEQPDLEALRQELNEQFESIKIVRPGEYELNLMELYDRDEYIISLMEDGRYAIEVPDAWRDGE